MSLQRSVLSSTALVLAICSAAPAFAQARVFDVPAQDAVRAIPELARQAHLQIVASARDLTGVRTAAIKGTMDARDALRRLIAGTPLRIISDDGQIVTLRSDRPGDQRGMRKGVLRGRVFNAATGQYLQNAEVRIGGSNSATYTDSDGSFRIGDVPIGSATIIVRYAGLADYSSVANVTDDQAAALDIQMVPQALAAGSGDITVVGARSGQAAALMTISAR
jgi:iron complex outermembrane receptor protein